MILTQTPSRRFKRPRILIVGFGDVGQRLARHLAQHPSQPRIITVSRSITFEQTPCPAHLLPIKADLDLRQTLKRAAALADKVVFLAPPPNEGTDDPRLRHWLFTHCEHKGDKRWVYISTTGVYGSHPNQIVAETTPTRPDSPRAQRRATAERILRQRIRQGVRAGRPSSGVILRAPGIYAENRLPVDRIRKGLPALLPSEDSWSNHIHADDLARAAWLTLMRHPRGQRYTARAYNAVDGHPSKMGDWFDQVADAAGLARVPRKSRAEVQAEVGPMMWSFMKESRQIDGQRLPREYRFQWRWESVTAFLAQRGVK